MRTFLSLIIILVLLLSAAPGRAFDISLIAQSSSELQACISQKVGESVLESVIKGEMPKDKKIQKRLKKAYERCVLMTSETTPDDINPYTGPLFDAMSQIDETVDSEAAIQRVKDSGVTRLALFARSQKRLHQNERLVLGLAQKYPELIVLGAPKYFQLSGDLTHSYIQATVEGIKEHGYCFVGEILYTHGDKKSGKQYLRGERYVDPSKPGTKQLLEALAPLNIPVMTHWEPYAPQRDFPKFHALYEAWPDQVFIVPHMGFASPKQVDEFMGRHPNLYMVISKKERLMEDFADSAKQSSIGSAFLDGFRLRPEWKTILIRYQDRLLFGTDPHMKKLWERYPTTIKFQRLVLGQLPFKAAEKIAWKNAEKLYL
jgi:hypothetical protein